MIKSNIRQKNGLKHCGNCYITIKGKVYIQYTDNGDKGLLKELKKQGKDVIIRLIDKTFYRIYIYEKDKNGDNDVL